jgi:hypothetical protein
MLKYYNNTTKTLTIPHKFNEELKDIPDNAEYIIFYNNYRKHEFSFYNKVIKENVLPVSLHTLTLSYNFNQEIKENVLPVSLHTLIFGHTFNQEIKENVLPVSLHMLTFGWNFDQEIKENVLPVSLHTLGFGFNFNQEIKENVLPKSIKYICLYSHCNFINNLPLQLEEIYIVFTDWTNIEHKEVNNLPITLERITIKDEKYLKYITKIPFGCDIVIHEKLNK